MAKPIWALVAVLCAAGACAPQPPSEAPFPTAKVASEFVFDTHAFSFANFGGKGVHGSALTAEEMSRMFGPKSVCNPDVREGCKLLPVAREYMLAVDDSLAGGRCEGFAVLSGLAAHGEVDLTPFGAADARSLILDDNVPLGRELAYWFATQYLRDVVPETTRAMFPNDVVKMLGQELSVPGHLMYRLGIARIDPTTGAASGGHAVLATYVAPGASPNAYVIGIYDNNHPDAEREIAVDAATNTWSYQASSNPDDPATLYAGGTSNPIYVSPVEPRSGVHPCTFCSLDDVDADALFAQVFGSASAEIVAIGTGGAYVGERDGRLVDAHPEGHVLPSFTAACHDCRDGMHLALPHGEEGTTLELRQAVHAPRTDDGAVVDISARFFGHGFGVLVEGADVERGEVHTLHIPAEGASAEYTSASASSADEVDVTVATSVDGDEQVYVEARVAGTERFTLTLATDTGDPTLQARGPNAAADAELHIETTQGEVSRDLHVEVPLPPNGSARVVLARSTPGGTVTVELDDDGDGVVDDTVELADLPEGP